MLLIHWSDYIGSVNNQNNRQHHYTEIVPWLLLNNLPYLHISKTNFQQQKTNTIRPKCKLSNK